MHEAHPSNVKRLFDEISPRYDQFNSVTSFGADGRWRRAALSVLSRGMRVLDIGTGTGDLALAALERVGESGEVVGMDFSAKMLRLAEEKRQTAKIYGPIRWVCASALDLPLSEGAFDAVLSSFVMRNLRHDIRGVLRGVRASLRPGGWISFVDLTEPEAPLIRAATHFYLSTIVTSIGSAIFRSRYPVQYLRRSVKDFFRKSEFVELLRSEGFESIQTRSFLLGLVTHYTACNPGGETPR